MDHTIAILKEVQWTIEDYAVVNVADFSSSLCAGCFLSECKAHSQGISNRNVQVLTTTFVKQIPKWYSVLKLLDGYVLKKVLKKINTNTKTVLKCREAVQRVDHEEHLLVRRIECTPLRYILRQLLQPIINKTYTVQIDYSAGISESVHEEFREQDIKLKLVNLFSDYDTPNKTTSLTDLSLDEFVELLASEIKETEDHPISADLSGSSTSSLRTTRQNGENKPRKDRGVTGLCNMGNTCYMNAVLQCLSNTAPLVEYFLSWNLSESEKRDKGKVAISFADLIVNMWLEDTVSISPDTFLLAISEMYSLFGGQNQQDAQELLMYTLNALHEDLLTMTKTPKRRSLLAKESSSCSGLGSSQSESSIITRLLQGVLRYDIICLECERTSEKNEVFTVLSLPIPDGNQTSLQDCLQCFFKQVMLTWADKMYCSHCKLRQDASVKVSISKPPKIIIFHFKRFEYQGQIRRKLNTNINFPLKNLDLSPFLSPNKVKHSKYNLYAVVNHFGDLDYGHYTASCKNATTKQWNTFDDSRFFKISEDTVQSPSAYILFYTSRGFSSPVKPHTFSP
ncbi:ubiquitin carboxyl-terminal hydrolase 50 [Pelodytes ibericus]